MRLRRLWLGKFYNLDNVEVEFDDARSIYGATSLRFFVGLNGSGKSNALEAIGLIFSHLAADASPGFDFDIEYELKGSVVRLTTRLDEVVREAIPQIGAALLIRPAEPKEAAWRPEHLVTGWASSGDAVLPGRVIGYATGPTSGLQRALSSSIEKLVKGALGEFEEAQRPQGMSDTEWQAHRAALREDLWRRHEAYLDNPDTIFLGSEDAVCAVLSLLAHEGVAETDPYLACRSTIIGRVGLDEREPLAAFTLRVAGNWRERLTPRRAPLLERLLRLATARTPIDPDPDLKQPSDGMRARDFYAVFEPDEKFRRQTICAPDLMPTPLAFLEELLAWKRQGALREIRLVLKKRSLDELLSALALSDGEFLYLGRLALLLMMRDVPDCLILLDEPETHFNDHWKVQLIQDIHGILSVDAQGAAPSHSHEVIIATHSDLTLTDADPDQVYVFSVKEEEGGEGGRGTRIEVGRPPFSTFAANRGDISQGLFATPAPVGNYSRTLIEAALRGGDRAEVERLLDTVGPGYYRFVLRDRLSQLERRESGGAVEGEQEGGEDAAAD